MTWTPRGLGLKGPDLKALEYPKAVLPSLDPATLSFTYLDMFGPVEDQNETSECWVYSVSGMLEAYHYRRLGSRFVVSKRAAAYFATAANTQPPLQDAGGYPSWTIAFYETGYVLESAWPSDSSDDTVQMNTVPNDLLLTDFKASGLVSLPTSSDGVILGGHEHGPVALCVNWPADWYGDTPLGSDGVLTPLGSFQVVGGHAIVLAAHEPAGKIIDEPVTMIRNSWGAWAGGAAPSGYAWMRDSDLQAILTDGNVAMSVNA